MQTKPNFYFDYFASLLVGDSNLTADISPSYCALKAERMTYIKNGFKSKDIAVKAVILLRDPVDRVKSSVRFGLDCGYVKAPGRVIVDTESGFNEVLENNFRADYCVIRTQYQHAIEEAKKAFAPDEIYIGVYEAMFTPAEIQRLSDFLGIPAKPELAKVRKNVSSKPVAPSELDIEIRQYYSDVYEYCFEHIPSTRRLWMS